MDREQIWISQHSTIEFASNFFTNVETILRVDDQRMIYLTDTVGTDHSLAIDLFSPDGERIAVSKGARLFLTPSGEKMGLKIRREPDLWVCEGGGNTFYEARFKGPAALAISAELYAPSGKLLRYRPSASQIVELKPNGMSLAGSAIVSGCTFIGNPVGVHLLTVPDIQPAKGAAIVISLAGT